MPQGKRGERPPDGGVKGNTKPTFACQNLYKWNGLHTFRNRLEGPTHRGPGPETSYTMGGGGGGGVSRNGRKKKFLVERSNPGQGHSRR